MHKSDVTHAHLFFLQTTVKPTTLHLLTQFLSDLEKLILKLLAKSHLEIAPKQTGCTYSASHNKTDEASLFTSFPTIYLFV